MIENQLELGVNGAGRIQASYGMRNRQRRAMREVNRYGVSKMADPAVLLVFDLVVPVARRLKSERQHHNRNHNGQKPVCRAPLHIRTENPRTDIT